MKRRLKRLFIKATLIGNKFECPICGYKAKSFLPGGLHTKRLNAKCPSCGCVERQRILWRYLQKSDRVLNEPEKSLLHFAPEPALRKKFERLLPKYNCSDYGSDNEDYAFDLMQIACPDSQWDYLICFHILEHVDDDRQAMRELFRILKPGGIAFVQVPIWPSEMHLTYENQSITDSRDRQITFGQDDHLRIYGLDVVQRLTEAGFEVQSVRYADFFDQIEIHRYALANGSGISEVFFCCKKHV